jgi:glycosyltransferase involved in cell wall biosynthesis
MAVDRPPFPSISVIAPVRNERHTIGRLLAVVESQTLRPAEVVVADGCSDDGTREWLEQAAATRPWLKVVDNPERIIPSGLNRAIAAASGEIVARMDAHALYAPDYLERLAEVLAANPHVTGAGGAMATSGRGPWGEAIAAVLRRPFGLGGARHRRRGAAAGPIEHVFSGAYRREALLEIGGYDPNFLANEDFEVDHRLRGSGGTIWLEPRAQADWYTRDSVPELARQMWRYGFYKARTLLIHPRSLKPRQLGPPLLVLGLATATLARPRLGAAGLLGYTGVAVGLGAAAGWADGAAAWRSALVPPVVHLSWGTGLLVGLVRHRGAAPAGAPAPPWRGDGHR